MRKKDPTIVYVHACGSKDVLAKIIDLNHYELCHKGCQSEYGILAKIINNGKVYTRHIVTCGSYNCDRWVLANGDDI